MLNHTGGTYSHNGMMDYPRIFFTEWYLGEFPDSVEFQSWKINFRTEACLRTADPQITMLWVKEVEGTPLRARSLEWDVLAEWVTQLQTHVVVAACLAGCWLAGWLVGWLVGWLAGWLVGWLPGWLAGWLAAWLVGWLVGCLLACLFAWLVGWVAGWLVG